MSCTMISTVEGEVHRLLVSLVSVTSPLESASAVIEYVPGAVLVVSQGNGRTVSSWGARL